jgi:hypothetical protein
LHNHHQLGGHAMPNQRPGGEASGQPHAFQELRFEGGRLEAEFGGGTSPLVTEVRIGNPFARKGRRGEASGAPAAATRNVIWVNMEGGTYVAGPWPDDSRNRRSWLVGSYGWRSRTFAAYNGDRAEVLRVMQSLFSRFDVEVTDRRPAAGSFIDCVITGSSSSVLGCGCGGVAPMSSNCALIPTAIVFTFAPGFGSPRRIAEVAAQEVGHAIGLDHEMLCQDPMSYLQCGAKTFQDQYVACGEFQARRCQCGGVQNSVQELYRKLGRRPDTDPNPGNATIRFLRPRAADATLQGNTKIEISVDVTDPQGVGKVELLWDFTNGALDCERGGNGVDWSCEHQEGSSVYTWTLDVGTGDRTYRVRVTDNSEPTPGVTVSPSRVIHLTRDEPPDCVAPEVEMLGLAVRGERLSALAAAEDPAERSAYAPLRAGDAFVIRAEVRSPNPDVGIREVQVVWIDPSGVSQSPMLRVGDNLWELDVRLAADAQPGHRSFCVRAVNFEGESSTTEHEIIRIG